MKSVKPGRGPSAMGVWGAAVAVIFGIFWTIMAASMGAPGIFPVFGVLFIITGVISGVYNYKNATGKNRYSTFDITDDGEETDPLEERFGNKWENRTQNGNPSAGAGQNGQSAGGFCGGFCPYCGTPAQGDFEFCPKCGKRLP